MAVIPSGLVIKADAGDYQKSGKRRMGLASCRLGEAVIAKGAHCPTKISKCFPSPPPN